MLLTITTTHSPATDLGYLLHKNPARFHSVSLPFGEAHAFYPEATAERCTAALMLYVDPVQLARGAGRGEGRLREYVNDRPYVASSFLSVALARVFGSAMGGRSKERAELATQRLPLIAKISAVFCGGGEAVLKKLFQPLGYSVIAERHPLDSKFPEWGESAYFTVQIAGEVRLSELLAHLYVLIPVLDDEKHYWVGEAEVEKLLSRGTGWLAAHPEREFITRRYLRHHRSLMRDALERLVGEEVGDADSITETHTAQEQQVEEKIALNEQRLGSVVAALRAAGARRVLDLGCGEGRLLKALLEEKGFEEIVGLDVSHRNLEKATVRLRLDQMAPRQKQRIQLLHGSLMYRDARLTGYDAAAVVEVIEHLDPPRLAAFERVLFEFARPTTAVITTPNVEYNAQFESLPAGRFRHKDHRFEWSRAEFRAWATRVAGLHGYSVRFLPVGPEDAALGAPTQMAVFSL